MKYQKNYSSLFASLTLLVLVSACGKNLSLQVDTSKLSNNGTTQGTGDDTIDTTKSKTTNSTSGSADSNSDSQDGEDKTGDASTSGSVSTVTASSASEPDTTSTEDQNELNEGVNMALTGVLQPFSVADLRDLTDDLRISMTRDDRDQKERKVARAIFKVRPYESLKGETKTETKTVVTGKGRKKKTKTETVTTSTAGELKVTLVISKANNNVDFNNLKICLFRDIANDSCLNFAELLAAGAFVSNPIEGDELKVDLLKVLGAKDAAQSVDLLFSSTSEYAKYFRKIRLSFEGVEKVIGSKLIVESKDRAGAATAADYDEATVNSVVGEELIEASVQ